MCPGRRGGATASALDQLATMHLRGAGYMSAATWDAVRAGSSKPGSTKQPKSSTTTVPGKPDLVWPYVEPAQRRGWRTKLAFSADARQLV